MARTDLGELFDEIADPRVQRTRRHRLTDALVLVLLGTVVGCRGWDGIERFSIEREAELRELLALPGGIPSADTLRRVMAAVDAGALARALTRWTDALCETYVGKQIAIDGKSIRGTLERAEEEGALHRVNAWVCEHQMVLGQYATDVKSNEITAIPKLLELLHLRGSTVTIDAIGCQKGIARQIVDQGADYIFGLKSNQPGLHREVLEAFDEATCARLALEPGAFVETADKGHGRHELRRVWVERDVSWLARSNEWPGLQSLILVEAERTRRGQTSRERRTYISSSDESAATLASKVRGHWHVENKLHWAPPPRSPLGGGARRDVRRRPREDLAEERGREHVRDAKARHEPARARSCGVRRRDGEQEAEGDERRVALLASAERTHRGVGRAASQEEPRAAWRARLGQAS